MLMLTDDMHLSIQILGDNAGVRSGVLLILPNSGDQEYYSYYLTLLQLAAAIGIMTSIGILFSFSKVTSQEVKEV